MIEDFKEDPAAEIHGNGIRKGYMDSGQVHCQNDPNLHQGKHKTQDNRIQKRSLFETLSSRMSGNRFVGPVLSQYNQKQLQGWQPTRSRSGFGRSDGPHRRMSRHLFPEASGKRVQERFFGFRYGMHTIIPVCFP